MTILSAEHGGGGIDRELSIKLKLKHQRRPCGSDRDQRRVPLVRIVGDGPSSLQDGKSKFWPPNQSHAFSATRGDDRCFARCIARYFARAGYRHCRIDETDSRDAADAGVWPANSPHPPVPSDSSVSSDSPDFRTFGFTGPQGPFEPVVAEVLSRYGLLPPPHRRHTATDFRS